ncbi:MAG: glutamine--fructose-6-phosphate transaminase (isomerizing), partial [Anaerolineae bacterium]
MDSHIIRGAWKDGLLVISRVAPASDEVIATQHEQVQREETMCGIVGYTGSRHAVPLVLEGLRRLEYRGYDSAGLATIQDGALCIRRAEGKLSNLERLLQEQPAEGHVAIGHTRWATHGAPCQRNAHPHIDCRGDLAVIQNGIVENFLALRQELLAQGHRFLSDTDTEVIVHLVEAQLAQGYDLVEAARRALSRIKGAHAIVLLSRQTPDTLIAARIGNAGGVIVGVGEGEMFLASDIPAILEHTRRMIFLEDGEMAIVRAQGAQFLKLDGSPLNKSSVEIPWDPVSAAKGPYRHFMQKEILEQARSITDTLRGRIDFARGQVELPELKLPLEDARTIGKIIIVACGTSAYAGLIGKFMFEKLARIPVEVDYASEFRYRDPLITPGTLVLAITQSGETADTLAALEEAHAKGARTISIVNMIGSMAQRISDGYILMQAGPEIGVASTKAFTASLVDQLLL